MVKKFKVHLISASCFLCSCTVTSDWAIDHISTGISTYDTSRLKFISHESHPPMCFEMVKVDSEVVSFLSLERFHFTNLNEITVQLKIGDESFEDKTAIHEGGMRIRLHSETTQRVIQALQEGKQVVILADGFEETLDANHFSNSFSQFLGEGQFF